MKEILSPLSVELLTLWKNTMLIDTHAHLYAGEFADDRERIVQNAVDAGIEKILMPNIDQDSILKMLELNDLYPELCLPMMGLHPTSVGPDYEEQLKTVDGWLGKRPFCAIGEIGIDLYWDRTYWQEQKKAFRIQLQMARSNHYPVVIHVRESFDEVFPVVCEEQNGMLRGVFHCFSGSPAEAQKITGEGFLLGIGGVVTFKNSTLPETLKTVSLKDILLETDAPYLAPVPHRGKRNQMAYLGLIAGKVSEIYELPFSDVANATTRNAKALFGIDRSP